MRPVQTPSTGPWLGKVRRDRRRGKFVSWGRHWQRYIFGKNTSSVLTALLRLIALVLLTRWEVNQPYYGWRKRCVPYGQGNYPRTFSRPDICSAPPPKVGWNGGRARADQSVNLDEGFYHRFYDNLGDHWCWEVIKDHLCACCIPHNGVTYSVGGRGSRFIL